MDGWMMGGMVGSIHGVLLLQLTPVFGLVFMGRDGWGGRAEQKRERD
jgi:hypothetical protein